MNSIGLNEIKTKETVIINELLSSPISNKLIEMGFYKGKQIKIKFKAPLGDPIAIEIDGALLSLRLSEAQLIKVEKIS